MINISTAFKQLIEQSELEPSSEVYKLKAVYFQKPYILIGIDLVTKEKRLYIDVTDEEWTEEQLAAFPKWKGLSLTSEYFEKIGPLEHKEFLIISQENEANDEIFEKVIQSIVDHILVEEEQPLFTVLYGVLDRWHNFFRANRYKKLTEEEQMGIFGELFYLHSYLEKHPEEPPLIIDYWKGPMKHRIDFVKNNTGVEIKTLSPKLRNEIRISSEKQLELTEVVKQIYLFVLEIEATHSDGQTIQGLINLIRERLMKQAPSILVRFNDLLLMELSILDDIYNDTFFYVHKEELYEVTEAFPKLTSIDVPLGVCHLSYTIDLSHCVKYKMDVSKVYSLK